MRLQILQYWKQVIFQEKVWENTNKKEIASEKFKYFDFFFFLIFQCKPWLLQSINPAGAKRKPHFNTFKNFGINVIYWTWGKHNLLIYLTFTKNGQ